MEPDDLDVMSLKFPVEVLIELMGENFAEGVKTPLIPDRGVEF